MGAFDEHFQPTIDVGNFENRLLSLHGEWGGVGDDITECGRIAVAGQEAKKLVDGFVFVREDGDKMAENLGPLEFAACSLSGLHGVFENLDLGLAVKLDGVNFSDDPDSLESREFHEELAVGESAFVVDFPERADGMERDGVGRWAGLGENHGDLSIAGEGVLGHLLVPRFEDPQWKPTVGEKDQTP
jgi:hypothetical protein